MSKEFRDGTSSHRDFDCWPVLPKLLDILKIVARAGSALQHGYIHFTSTSLTQKILGQKGKNSIQ